MVFKFFKEIVGAIKEGIDEAKQEVAQEEAEERAKEQLEHENQLEQVKSLPQKEVFFTALGAPYRRLFVADTSYYLSAMDVPADKKEELARLIARDFDVMDKASLMQMAKKTQTHLYAAIFLQNTDVKGMNDEELLAFNDLLPFLSELAAESITEKHLSFARQLFLDKFASLNFNLPEDSKSLVALWMSRFSYAASVSVGLGYLSIQEAYGLFEPIVEVGLTQITDWQAFGELFIKGEKQDGTNNVLGRKALSMQVDQLLEQPLSPWLVQAWPQKLTDL